MSLSSHDTDLDKQTISAAQTTTSASVAIIRRKGFCVVSDLTNTTPSAGTFTANAATDICTKVAHAMLLGLKVQLSTSSALPAGLSTSTDYFVIPIDADTFKLATSLVNANAGTAIDITNAGTGTQTITPTALSMTATIYGSSKGSGYVALTNGSFTVTATGKLMWEYDKPKFTDLEIIYTVTAGQFSTNQQVDRNA